jgi:hypothetical protein
MLKTHQQGAMLHAFIGCLITRSSNELLLVTYGCATINSGTHQHKTMVGALSNKKNCGCGLTFPTAIIPKLSANNFSSF